MLSTSTLSPNLHFLPLPVCCFPLSGYLRLASLRKWPTISSGDWDVMKSTNRFLAKNSSTTACMTFNINMYSLINQILTGFSCRDRDFERLNHLNGEGYTVFNTYDSNQSSLNIGLHSLILPTKESVHIPAFRFAIMNIRRIKGYDKSIGALLMYEIFVELHTVKWIAHLFSVYLLSIRTISGLIDKVVYAMKYHN